MNTGLPKKIKIGPYRIPVIRKKDLKNEYDDELYGQFNADTFSIFINDTISTTKEPVTLLHEILHVVCFNSGVYKDKTLVKSEEKYVSLMATGLAQVMQDNPKLMRYLSNAMS